ncbi:MAG: trypsin-like peptidase domain-containing protein [Treponema sp.]|uniref:S1 family peptidase n=1 Tax=Treponema sp. TaxID=166 RepID=UPI00298E572E|nr:trypsin-like peptidase domain-containing protein [Treponema sp.]MBR5933007.1 trypsin-like peptidase domain-containing protein [Treponema sp.]
MKNFAKKILFTVVALSCFSGLFAQETLNSETVDLLQSNVFEVVTLKVEEDPLTYERKLPLDRLPYHIRTDKYDSIGTAFLMDDGYLYTAAHVLSLYHLSQHDKFFIRDSEGNTYKIGKVYKFASDRDFVVFDAIGFDPSGKGLSWEPKVKKNSTVFAVGNAQGEGIVIRNGLLTSETPENRNGKWKWLRFSAAASPGNSGGPLVTTSGKVCGIVTMKNSSENLNYALPAGEISKVENNKGEIHLEFYYRVPNILTQKFYHTFDDVVTLPMELDQLRDSCYKKLKENTSSFFYSLVPDYRYNGKESFTVKDTGSYLLSKEWGPEFPNVICLNEKGKWGCYSPENVSTLKLEKNGKINIGAMCGFFMTYLKKPDNMTVEAYIKDPKLLMDTLAKALTIPRVVASEQIKITSYGKPALTSTTKDVFGRTWIISAYTLPFADGVMYNLSLPLPDGIFTLTALDDTDSIYNGFVYDLEFVSNFVIAGYKGTFKDWKEYMAIPESVYPRHEFIKNAKIVSTKTETEFSISNLNITCPMDVVKIDDKTDIYSGITLRPEEKNGLKLEMTYLTIIAQENTNDETTLLFEQKYKPNKDASKEDLDSYKKVCAKTIPYDGKPFEHDQNTHIFISDEKSDHVTVLGLIYKGNKMKVIEERTKKLVGSIKE